MKTKIAIFGLLLITIIFSCNSKQKEKPESQYETMDLTAPAPQIVNCVKFSPSSVSDEIVVSDYSEENYNSSKINKKKIIKDGTLSIKASDIVSSKKFIDKTIKSLNCYYEIEELENSDRATSYTLKIRIPAENFEKLVASFENGRDEITNKRINARDVTEEYMDIETRLTNKKEYLKRYKELLPKASTIEGILSIEENIRVLQEEIESREGRLKYLNDQIAYSTLDINLYKLKKFVTKPIEQDKFSERIKKSLNSGWASVIDFTLGTIAIWPVVFVSLLLIIIFVRIIKKRKRNN